MRTYGKFIYILISFFPLPPETQMTYHPDTHTYGFCFKSSNNTGTIRTTCAGKGATYIPTMELTLEGAAATWSLTRQSPELPLKLKLARPKDSSFHQYYEASFKDFNESQAAWHLCRI